MNSIFSFSSFFFFFKTRKLRIREGKLCGQGVTVGWRQSHTILGLRKDLTIVPMLLILVVKRGLQLGWLLSEGACFLLLTMTW